MPRPVDNARPGACVNVLKKVRTNGGWKLCPAVREANGRLRDRVRVNGHSEVHSEGVYYLEWREDGRRRREAIAKLSQQCGANSLQFPGRSRFSSATMPLPKCSGDENRVLRCERE
jgi:hypothetical protein